MNRALNDAHAMTPACRELFEYALRHVTPKAVADFCPHDPGYPDYVREFTAILSTGVPPSASSFEISECVNSTRWTDAASESGPVRFRRFRAFTNSVGVAICSGPEGPSDGMPPNYFGISLLDDAYALNDSEFLRRLFPVFQELHKRIAETQWGAEEALFFLLGQIVLAFMGFAPSASIPSLCEQLIAEESRHKGRASPEFLWGCTCFDQLHHQWKRFVEFSFPVREDSSCAALLRDALLSE
jgi:hypothetical protein